MADGIIQMESQIGAYGKRVESASQSIWHWSLELISGG